MRHLFTIVLPVFAFSLAQARGEDSANVLDKAPSKFAESGDIKVHYKSLGEGDTAVIFVHGWCCDHTVWHDQAAAFDGKVRMLFVDLPGYGKSDKPKIDYTMDVFAKGVEAAMRDAGVEKAVLAGHSMGTPVVRQFYRLFPEKTKGLIFVDGSLRPMVTDPEQVKQFLSMFREETFKETAPRFLAGMLPEATPAEVREHVLRLAGDANPHVAVSSMNEMLGGKIWNEDPVKVPAQALMAVSPYWDEDYKEFVKKLVPGLDYREFEGVGHFLFMEKPGPFNEAMGEFLRKQGMLK